MLEFNQEHKIVDLSIIKPKFDKIKGAGKVAICGIALSSALLFSGCSKTNNNATQQSTEIKEVEEVKESKPKYTAIITENGNALIVDLKTYSKRSEGAVSNSQAVANDRTWVLYTVSGDIILVNIESVKIIIGEDSHEKAQYIAQFLLGENGQVIYYDEVEAYGRTR